MSDTDAQVALTPADQNQWYLLATLHGVPGGQDKEDIQAKNRVTWNRYYALRWRADERERLKGKVAEAELQPFSPQELAEIKALFSERAGDDGITIPDAGRDIDCKQLDFNSTIDFSGYVFADVNFSNSSFFKEVSFRGAIFTGRVEFKYTKFFDVTRFINNTFNNDAIFSNATFSSGADFRESNFKKYIKFTNTKLNGPTTFAESKFELLPPEFAGATLHQRTNWRRVSWPQPHGLSLTQVEVLTDAYSCLKMEMDKQKRHHDELMFFSKELECRKVELGNIKGFPISLYRWTCDYGQSIILPLIWLFDLTILGWNVIMSAHMPGITWDKALLASIANSLGSFGVRKELMESLPKPASTGMQFFLMIQSIVALILLFLIGLGLRNRFRMK